MELVKFKKRKTGWKSLDTFEQGYALELLAQFTEQYRNQAFDAIDSYLHEVEEFVWSKNEGLNR